MYGINIGLTYHDKIIISTIIGMIWIYFRKLENYSLLPRKSVVSVLLVGFWIYCNYKEPLSLPIGLLLMYLYSLFINKDINL